MTESNPSRYGGDNPNPNKGKSREQTTNWRGTAAGYYALHRRVEAARGKAGDLPCAHCSEQARDWALLHDQDPQETSQYIPLCRSCHIAYDIGSHPRKLTADAVRDIRARQARGETGRSLAAEYKIDPSMVSLIVLRKKWRHIA